MQNFKSTPQKSLFVTFITKFHHPIIWFFVLPLSFLYDIYLGLRNWIFWNFLSNSKLHNKRVKEVQDQVIAWNNSQSTKPMCTARPAWMTMSLRVATFKKDCHRIKINLRDILDIDLKKKTIRVEPLVSMGQITRYLLKMGYALAVMVEMEDLTAGGLAMGVGMETNCHRIGLIQENIVAYELVLGDGRLIRATATENADLFYALPWSHGTLGFLVALELKIIPVKPYMHLTYTPCYNLDDFCKLGQSLAMDPNGPEFLEANIFSKDRAVILSGNFADVKTAEEKAKINRINLWFKPWFYKHVASFLERGKSDEFIPLRHYYHRYTRSIFWELEPMIPFGNHPLYRWLFGWLGAPKIAFLKLVNTPGLRRETVEKHVVQDFILPIAEMKRSILLADELFNVYPLLVFFMKISETEYQGFLRKPQAMIPGKKYGMYFDLGIYGIPSAVKNNQTWIAKDAIRKAEAYVREVKGYQCLYADIFATQDEFKQMFDHTLYEKMRKKYKAEKAFPYVYDKVKGQW